MRFPIFLPFRVRLASKFAKSANMTLKLFVQHIFNMGIRNAEYDANFETVEKVAKMLTCRKLDR
jgi:hypothetical protein